MTTSRLLRKQLKIRRTFIVQFVSLAVGAHGLFIVAITLLDQIAARRGSHLSDITIDLSLMIGLGLVYLSTLLRRRKRTAWLVTMLAYAFYLGESLNDLAQTITTHNSSVLGIVRSLVVPMLIVSLLFFSQREFVVRSDTQGFRLAARLSVTILLIAFVYGVTGFLLLDKSDFHQEIPFATAVHYTVDQFDLTTDHPLHPDTKRAHLFVDSLSVVSIGAVAYAVIALFQPLRAKIGNQNNNRQQMLALLISSNAQSEEYFKLWPHDKQYFFNQSKQAGLSYRAYRGMALCLSDPIGRLQSFGQLLQEFNEFCFGNDWQPALIHIGEKHHNLYRKQGFSLQKIGQEAILDLIHFEAQVSQNKYFRHIRNKFTKHGFTTEVLSPPHHRAVIARLQVISDDWLSQGTRSERGFVMGYFSEVYLQQCQLMVLRDAAGTITAFLNQLPADFDKYEASYDMLRQTSDSLSNSVDFLLLNFIDHLQASGYSRLNLGLCPLAGMDEIAASERTLIDSAFGFAYANSDRFYSFSGLYRFKSKYEPEWHDRFIAYQGGIRGLSRTINALIHVMRVKR